MIDLHRLAPLIAALATPSLPAEVLESLDPTIVEAERVEDETAAVSVLSRDSLDLFQPQSFADLSGLVPGFYVVSSDSRGFGQVVTMRGSTNTLFFSPPSLGLYIDDVPLGDAFSYPSELLDLSEVRVHRGPQGPYFGRNGPAGMVEMFTPRPSDQSFNRLTAEYGSYSHFNIRLLSSGPLTESLSYSLQLFRDQRDGYIHNTHYDSYTDDRQATGGLFNLFWSPCDDFELRLRFYAEKIDDGSQRLTSLFTPDPFTVASDHPGVTQLDRYQLSLHSKKDLSWGKIETISSYQIWDLNPSTVDLDLSNTAANGGRDLRSGIVQKQDLISNELRFSSDQNASPVTWRAGLFQLWTDNEGLASRQLAPGFVENTDFTIKQLNLAAFGNATWQASESVAIDAGLRVDYYKSKINRRQRDPFPGDDLVYGNKNDVFVSPTLGLTWDSTPALRFFLRSGLGIKPGGYTAYSDNPVLASFDREQNWSNEIGLEYACPAYHLRFGLRGYYDRIDDYQLNQSLPLSTDFLILNAERVNSKGVEADLAWTPTDPLTIRGSFGYVNAEFDSFQDPFTPGTYYDGNKVPFVPKYTGSLGIRYDFRRGFYAQTSVRLAGSTPFDAANTSTFTQDAYLLWDAEIGYATERFSVALYGRNLLDESYYTFINPQIFAASPGNPQIFGLRVSRTF